MSENEQAPTLFANKPQSSPESAQDPIRIMIEIAENQNLSEEDKRALILHSQNRFKNRRHMAYISLITIVITVAVLLIAAFIDGLVLCDGSSQCEGILAAIEKNQTLLAWLEGFLTSIVAAYYGVTAWKPSS